MTPEQIDAVQRSWRELKPRADVLAEHFYATLFRLDPESERLFTTDPADQRRKLVDELDAITSAIPSLPAFVARVSALGDRHRAYGVHTHHYETVGAALLDAIDSLTPAASPELMEAWALAYNLVAEVMMRGAADGPAISSPP